MVAPILALRGINKSFGPIDVLHDITLEVKAGEVLCLLGDNGAGKSTLIKIMSGVHQPTSGVIEIDGAPVGLPTPARPPRSALPLYTSLAAPFR
jgi:simple sugar transport system ATP-binding protein